MNHKNLYIAVFAAASLVLLSPPVLAQPRNAADLADRIAAVEAEIAALKEATATMTTVAESTEALTARLATIEASLDRVRRAHESTPELIDEVDALATRTEQLSQQLERIRTDVAGMRRPPIPAPVKMPSWPLVEGRLQVRYQADFADGEATSAGFLIRRARIGLSGDVGDKLSYDLSFEMTDPALRDAFIDAELLPGLNVRAGQFKVHLTKIRLVSSKRIAFPDRPFVVDALAYDRDIGVGVFGDFWDGRARYFAGIVNGAGSNAPSDNLSVAEFARVYATLLGEPIPYSVGDRDVDPDPALAVGLAAAHDLAQIPETLAGMPVDRDVDADGDIDNVRLITASADVTFRVAGLELLAEAVLRLENFGSILEAPANLGLTPVVGDGEDVRFGFYAQATYMVLPKVMVGARFEQTDLPVFRAQGASVTEGAPVIEDVRAISGLVQLYGDDYRLLGVSYTFADQDMSGGNSLQAHTALAELQLVF